MRVVVVDYKSGNLRSVAKALEKAGDTLNCGIIDVRVTSDPEKVRAADRIVLPGVGAFADCRAGLESFKGLRQALEEAVLQNTRPFLGICVGMQLLADEGHEHGTHKGLGWMRGSVAGIKPDNRALKIPHMGWNTLDIVRPHPVCDGLKQSESSLHAYFVHSYHFIAKEPEAVIATTSYGETLTAIVAKKNMIGTQFHPEKSQRLGLKLLENFLTWAP